MSSKILSIISNWKDLNVPFDKFMYNGIDMSVKIEEDSSMMLSKLGNSVT